MSDLTQSLNREPTDEEIAKYMNMDLDKIQTILDLTQVSASLDTPVDDEGETTMGDLIADTGIENPLSKLIRESNSQIISSVFSSLEKREAEILKMRFGINVDKPMTLEEVGNYYHLSKERIRQLENRAIRKLRNPIRTKILKEAMS